MNDFTSLLAYKRALELAMEIYELTKNFPKEEKYSLTDQIRRSSRSVCGQIAEAYRKRRFPAHFTSKLTDGDGENSETQVWIHFSLACLYIHATDHKRLMEKSFEVGKLINHMINNPQQFGITPK